MRKLMRTRKDNVLAGVCGGIARYLSVDVVIVRIIWVISSLLGGFGLGTYIICALIIPKERYKIHSTIDEIEEDEDDYYDKYSDVDCEYDIDCDEEKNEKTKKYLGVALIFMGGMMSFKIMFPNFSFNYFWPVLLIIGGIMLLNREKYEEEE